MMGREDETQFAAPARDITECRRRRRRHQVATWWPLSGAEILAVFRTAARRVWERLSAAVRPAPWFRRDG